MTLIQKLFAIALLTITISGCWNEKNSAAVPAPKPEAAAPKPEPSAPDARRTECKGEQCELIKTAWADATTACSSTPSDRQCVLRYMLSLDENKMCGDGEEKDTCKKNVAAARRQLGRQ